MDTGDPVRAVDAETIEHILREAPLYDALPLKLIGLDRGARSLCLALRVLPQHERAKGSGQIHGGVIAYVIDVATTLASVAAAGHGTPTVNLRVDYLHAVKSGDDIVVQASVRRLGRTIAVVDCEVMDRLKRVVALGRGTFATGVDAVVSSGSSDRQ